MDASRDGYRILVITAGGTIAGHSVGGNNYTFLSQIEIIVDEIKKLLNDTRHSEKSENRYEIEEIKICHLKELHKDATHMCPEDWKLLIRRIKEEYANYNAFVITHGTNTMGYACAALSFALENLYKPVIMTGAQVSFGAPGCDARMNLENAIRLATYQYNGTQLVGVFAVFSSSIITGTRVKKKTEFDYNSFKAFNTNMIGEIGNSVRINTRALDKHLSFWPKPVCIKCRNKLDVKSEFKMCRVASLTEFPGMDSTLFEVLHRSKKDGFILRATGAGDPNVPESDANFDNIRKGFKYLQEKKIPIVVTTQAPDGIASMDINQPGKTAHEEFGAIPARDMSIESMTVKLAWLIGQGCSYEEIQKQMQKSLRACLIS